MEVLEVMGRLMHFKRAKVHDKVCTHDWLEEKFHQYACQIFCWMSFLLHIGSISAKTLVCCV